MGTCQVFIPLMRFLLQNSVSRSFLVLRNNTFFHLCLIVPASYIPWYFQCSFSLSVLILSWFGTFSRVFLLPFFTISMTHFSNCKFHSYILAVHSYSLSKVLYFFIIFPEYLYIIHTTTTITTTTTTTTTIILLLLLLYYYYYYFYY